MLGGSSSDPPRVRSCTGRARATSRSPGSSSIAGSTTARERGSSPRSWTAAPASGMFLAFVAMKMGSRLHRYVGVEADRAAFATAERPGHRAADPRLGARCSAAAVWQHDGEVSSTTGTQLGAPRELKTERTRVRAMHDRIDPRCGRPGGVRSPQARYRGRRAHGAPAHEVLGNARSHGRGRIARRARLFTPGSADIAEGKRDSSPFRPGSSSGARTWRSSAAMRAR